MTRLVLAIDSHGQRCNVLRVPVTRNTGDRAPTPLVEATEQDNNRVAADENTASPTFEPLLLPPYKSRDRVTEGEGRSDTPIKQVAAVAAEVADTAAKLDGVSRSFVICRQRVCPDVSH